MSRIRWILLKIRWFRGVGADIIRARKPVLSGVMMRH